MHHEVLRRQKILGLQRNVFFLGIVSFFNDFSSEMILSVFPAFFKSVLKAGAASLGIVEGIADATANIIKIFSGSWSDKLQKRKRIAVIGYVISVATRPFYLIAISVSNVTGLRVLDRIGKGIREAPRDALISLATESHELGRSFGYHKAMDSFGAILGPLAAFFLLRYFPNNFDLVFTVAFVTGLFALLAFIFVHEVPRAFTNLRIALPTLRAFSVRFKLFILSSFILASGALPVAVMLLRTQDLKLPISSIPLYYLVYNVSFTACSFFAGITADKVGDRRIITIGYLLLIASYGVLVFSNSALILVIAFLLLGVYAALTESIQRSYVARITEDRLRGQAYGFLSGAIGFGNLVAGIGGGITWELVGAPTALIIASLITISGLLLLQLHVKAY